MTAEVVPLILDPYDYHLHEDPYPYDKRLRDDAPLYRLVGVSAYQRIYV